MSKRITVSMSDEAFTKLGDEARAEFRPVRSQASWLLERLLTQPTALAREKRAELTEASLAALAASR